MANITVDIQAKVVGYEASIKQLQTALAKVDPGSDIGKKLVAALSQAQKQVQDLTKNMFPKASSNTQIDAIVEKVNRAGSAIQNVVELMQSLNVGDLNLHALGNEINSIVTQMSSLQGQIDSSLNQGIREAINSSEELKSIFSELGVDMTKITAESGGEALVQGLENAKATALDAQKAFDDAHVTVTKLESSLQNIKNIDVFGKADFNIGSVLGDLSSFANPEKLLDEKKIEELKAGIQERLSNLKLDNNNALQEQIDKIFSSLDPHTTLETFKTKWAELQSLLSKEGSLNNNAVTTVLGSGGKGTSVFNSLLGIDESQLTETQHRIVNLLNTFRSLFGEGQWNRINTLIDKGSIEQAAKEGSAIIEKAYDDFKKAQENGIEKLNEAKVTEAGAEAVLNQAKAEVTRYDNANTSYNNQVEALEKEISDLRSEVASLRAQLEGKINSTLSNLKEESSGVSKKVSGNMFPIDEAKNYKNELEQVQAKEQMLGKVQGVVQRWFSVYAVVRMVTNAIRTMTQVIQELDTTMTEIAIVTDMSQSDLWQQMPQYTKLARDYASSIKGVYEVSQIYYQQGLQMNEVMNLTEATLKMARISGLGYSDAADYMTNAVRSFKMEMSDAARVVDVYSAVAASSASNVTELATAMSKTASSAQAVGSSFENTTAMLAVMIEATRESPENIGSAMKSIISRYGELKENKTGIDSEGEEYSLNKVDTALQSVGISIHDVNGEFRDFDDVIFELAEHWDEIDKNTQRYIATIMAGNRQQSRFLALVSSSDRLQEEREKAENSEDASQLQFLKSLDSIDAKKQQLTTSIQSIYTNSGIEQIYKDILDFTNNILVSFDNLSSNAGLGTAIAKIGSVFLTLSTLVTNVFRMIKSNFSLTAAQMTAESEIQAAERIQARYNEQSQKANIAQEELITESQVQDAITKKQEAESAKRLAIEQKALAKRKALKTGAAMIASTLGLTATTYAASLDVNKDREKKSVMTGLGGVLSGVGTGLMIGGPAGAIMGVLTALPNLIEAIGMWSESTEEKINRLQTNINDTSNNEIKSKSELKSLTSYKKKYEELSKTQFESVEKQKEFKDLQNEIAENYPSLITSMDAEGNAIVNMNDAYATLLKTKQEVYTSDFLASLGAELAALQDIDYVMTNIYNKSPYKSKTGIFGVKTDNFDKLFPILQTSLKAQTGKTALEARQVSRGLADVGFNQLSTNDLMRMFYGGDIKYLDKLFEADATVDYSYAESQSWVDTVKLTEIQGAWRDVTSGVYSSIINMIANNKEVFFEDIKNLNPAEIFQSVYDSTNTQLQTLMMEHADEYMQMIADAIENFDESMFESIVGVKAGTNFAHDMSMAKIRSKNATYIQTLNEATEPLLDFTPTAIQQIAARQTLDNKTFDLITNWDKYFGTNYVWYDENLGKYQQFKKGRDEGKLLEAYYTGAGLFKHEGDSYNAVKVNDEVIDETWYETQLEEFSYLTEEVNELYSQLGSISKEELLNGTIREKLKGIVPADKIEETLEILSQAFDEEYGNIIQRYEKWSTEGLVSKINDEKIRNQIASFSNIIGPQYLQGIQDQFEVILKNSSLTTDEKNLQLQNLINIISAIGHQDLGLSSEDKDVMLRKLQTADFSSLIGIYTFINDLADAGINLDGTEAGRNLKSKLEALGNNLNTNLTTEIDSYAALLEESSDGLDSDLSAATSGMSLKKARELADKLGKNLSDFVIKDGKFYYNELDDIIKYYDKTDAEYEEALTKVINTRKENFSKIAKNETLNSEITSGKFKNWSEEARSALSEYFGIDYEDLEAYYNKYQDYLEAGGDASVTLFDYIINDLDTALSTGTEAIKQWATQQKSITHLNTFGFDSFWEQSGLSKFGDDAKQIILDAARDSNFEALKTTNEELYKAIEPYIETLLNFFKDTETSIINSLIDSVGTGKTAKVKVTQSNLQTLKTLQEKYSEYGLFAGIDFNDTKIINQSIDMLMTSAEGTEEVILSEIASVYKNDAEQLEAYQKYHANKYQNNIIKNFSNIADFGNITFDELTNYLLKNKDYQVSNLNDKFISNIADNYGLAMSASGDFYVKNWTKYIEQLSNDLNDLIASGAASPDINSVRVALKKAKQYQQDTINDLITSYSDVSLEQQEAFANLVNIDMDTLSEIFYYTGANGKTRLNVAALKQLIASGHIVDEAVQAILLNSFTAISDDYLNNITNATSLVMKGTSNQADIKNFIDSAADLEIDASRAFSYNSILNAWTLDPKIVKEYVEKQAQELVDAGLLTIDEVQDYLDINVRQTLAKQININEFLKAENKGAGGQAYRDLKTSLVNYMSSSSDLQSALIDIYVETLIPTKIPSDAQQGMRAALRESTSIDAVADFYIKQIKAGGAQAVKIMEAVAEAQGQELSASDVEAAYRVEVSALEDALDQLLYGIGSIVSGEAVTILSKIEGYTLQDIGGGSAIITQVGDISEAYKAYYDALYQTGEATLAALNEAKAMVLETQSGRAKEQQAIDALGDASNMTYTRLASLFTEAGIELTDKIMTWLMEEEHIIESVGGNKLRVIDPLKLAKAFNWDLTTEEGISALKTLNDSIIEVNKKVEQNITDEVKQLSSAHGGDQLNLTNLYMQLSKKITEKIDEDGNIVSGENPLRKVQDALRNYGATLENGILTLSDNADLYNIARELKEASKVAGIELQSSLTELEDTITDILKSYVDIIRNGINGALSGAEKLDLTQKAASWGIFNLDFTKTAEGFKLSEQSAIRLYDKLKQIDALQASLMFDDLRESLESTNESFKSVSSIMGYIANISSRINSVDSNVSEARLQQYEAELRVAKEILAVRSTSEDSSFNFMSNQIPAAQNNPLNYAKNWSSAFAIIRDAFDKTKVQKQGKTGFINYEDWYNIVTEMNNIAALGGPIELAGMKLDGSLESAANLIQQGAEALTTVDTGELKVNLGAIGTGISSASEFMGKQVTAGIRSMAKSQVSMLDSLIRMLELIVAMEQLGDITGDDSVIDLSDMFKIEYKDDGTTINAINEFTDTFDEGRKKLLDYLASNKDLQESFQNTTIKFNGKMVSLLDLLGKGKSKNELFNDLFGGLTGEDKLKAQETYQTLLNSLYQAAISGDYDLDNIGESVQRSLKENGLDLSDFVFNVVEDGKVVRTLTFVGETAIEIDYTDKDTRKAIDNYLGGHAYEAHQDEYAAYMQNNLNKYKTGKDGERILTTSELIELRTLIGIGANEFVLTSETDVNGNYVGYYDGQKFQGKDRNAVLKAMGEAATYKDQGFDFTVTLDETGQITIQGNTKIGSIEVAVEFTNEAGYDGIKYKYEGGEYNKSDLMAKLASRGEQETSGTYSFTDVNGHTYTSTVQYAINLGLSYSYVVEDGEETGYIMYQNHKFDNLEQLESFSEFKNKFDPQKNGTWDSTNKLYTTTTVVVDAEGNTLKINTVYDISTGTTTLKIGNQKFTDLNDNGLSAYLEASQQEGFKDITSQKEDTERIFEYKYDNCLIKGSVNLSTGDTEYNYSDAAGNIIGTAHSIEALELLINKENALAGLNDKTIEGQTVTWKINDVQVKLTIDKSGNVSLAEEQSDVYEGLSQEAKDAIDEKIAALNATEATVIENSVEGQVSSVTLTLAENAEVKMEGTINLTEDIPTANGKVSELTLTAETINAETNELEKLPTNIKAGVKVTDEEKNKLKAAIEAVKPTVQVALQPLTTAIDEVLAGGFSSTVTLTPIIGGIGGLLSSLFGTGGATGNLGLGNANAKGTLMGELGPELVVSNGRYFVVGQNGPEMIDLADDAIVFNHLQTKSLLEKGVSSGRGKAVTSERNAISFAKGNIDGGPAMASASQALAALRQLRAQWKSLESLSAEDLAGKAGGGGGGGGGKFLEDVERWYNWLQEIAKLEKKINYEEAKRARIQSDMVHRDGKAYYQSQKDTLDYLERQIQIQKDLNKEQKAFFEQRRVELNSAKNPFSQFYTFDEAGQIKYTDTVFNYNGKTYNGGLEALAEINKTDDYGNQVYNAKEQLAMVEAFLGKDVVDHYRKKDDGGDRNEAEILTAMFDNSKANQEEMQGLFDSFTDGEQKVEELITEENSILQEIEDNQITLENKVLKGIEAAAKREIDEMEKQRDAFEKSNQALIDGLSDALDKERTLYENSQNEAELDQKRRQLAILKRSGGSASEIASLQKEIEDSSRDMYFDKQQEQIDAIQEASDNQLEKLQEQIDIANETLEYQKENGLLWEQVYEVMNQSPEEIANFIRENDESYWGKSPTDLAQSMRDDLFEAEYWKAFAEEQTTVTGLLEGIADKIGVEREKEKTEQEAADEASRAKAAATSTTTNTDTGNTPKQKTGGWIMNGKWYATKESAEKYKNGLISGWESALKYAPTSEHTAIQANLDKWKKIYPTEYQYDRGGMVNKDQLALVHAKEAVLTPEQTSILRNEILGNNRDSALRLLQDFRAAYKGLETSTNTFNNGSPIVIEHAEVNMKVDRLANSYDAAQAGQDVMREIVNIARKTNAQNRVGR